MELANTEYSGFSFGKFLWLVSWFCSFCIITNRESPFCQNVSTFPAVCFCLFKTNKIKKESKAEMLQPIEMLRINTFDGEYKCLVIQALRL